MRVRTDRKRFATSINTITRAVYSVFIFKLEILDMESRQTRLASRFEKICKHYCANVLTRVCNACDADNNTDSEETHTQDSHGDRLAVVVSVADGERVKNKNSDM